MFSQVFTLKTTVFELSTDFTGVRQHFHFHFWNISQFFKLSLNVLQWWKTTQISKCSRWEAVSKVWTRRWKLWRAASRSFPTRLASVGAFCKISCFTSLGAFFLGQDPSVMASVDAFSWSLQNLIFNVFKVISGEQTAKATRDQISTVTIINEAMTDSQMWFNMM